VRRGVSPQEVARVLEEEVADLLEEYGVRRVLLFGPHAWGEAEPGEPLELLAEPREPLGVFELLHLRDRIASALGMEVDLVTPSVIRPWVLDTLMAEAVEVFEAGRARAGLP